MCLVRILCYMQVSMRVLVSMHEAIQIFMSQDEFYYVCELVKSYIANNYPLILDCRWCVLCREQI